MRDKIAIIIGAGPAGLSAAYHLITETENVKPIIIEKTNSVGGISKTITENGNATDIGPHRLFSKNQEIINLWEKLLPLQGSPAIDDKILNRHATLKTGGPNPENVDNVMLKRKRFSRIFYLGKFFDYPISLKVETILNLGLKRTTKAGFSYLKSCIHKVPEHSLEDFMINRFGKVLYKMFFEKYTEKVWGIHPSNISKEWGEQRIKGISLSKVLINALLSPFKLISKNKKETSLIEEYYYPKFGCSQLWQIMADAITSNGGEILFNTNVTKFGIQDGKIYNVTATCQNEEKIYNADYIISSMPIKELISGMENVPNDVKYVAENLQYRDYILASYLAKDVNLPNNTKFPTINNIAPDSWIYLQDDNIKAGRIHIMNNFSPYTVKDFEHNTLINLEYFCNENDELWSKQDDELLDFGISEFKKLGVLNKENIINSKCIRVKKAYPAYFGVYKDFDKIKSYLNSITNLYCIGRNGQHKYNNMDHSILSGIEVVNVIKNNLPIDVLWDVNTEQEYQETK